KIQVTDATLRQIKLQAGNKRDVVELSKLRLAVSDVKNGQTGHLELGADLQFEQNRPAPGTNSAVQARLEGTFSFGLSPDLRPGSIQGKTHIEVQSASGAFTDLTRCGADLNCDVAPTEIKQVSLQLARAGSPLGQVRVSGPFDLQRTEGHLSIELRGIDKQLLNVAGAA